MFVAYVANLTQTRTAQQQMETLCTFTKSVLSMICQRNEREDLEAVMNVLVKLITWCILWYINLLVLMLVGWLCSFKLSVAECTGVFVLLLWVRCMVGGGRH